MNIKDKQSWVPIVLVCGGIAAGAAMMFVFGPHGESHSATAHGGIGSLAGTDSKASIAAQKPESIEIDGTRIPPPLEAAEPAESSSEEKASMQFSPTAAGQSAGSDYDARTVIVDGRQLESGRTISGYPINVGRRAVDFEDPQQQETNPLGAAVTRDPGGWRTNGVADGPYIGASGMVENPAVDPPSTHGASYSRAY